MCISVCVYVFIFLELIVSLAISLRELDGKLMIHSKTKKGKNENSKCVDIGLEID